MAIPAMRIAPMSAGAIVPFVLLLAKATAILLLASLLARLARGASAGVRHLIWLTAIAGVMALPAAAAWSPLRLAVLPAAAAPDESMRALPPAPRPSATAPSASPAGVSAALPVANGPIGRTTGSVAQDTPGVGVSAVTLAIALWACIALVVSGWLANAAYAVRRILQRATPLMSPEWNGPLFEVADRLGLRHAPSLLLSDDTRMPFACGLVRPIIVLPAQATAWSDDRRRAVLLHELGHIRRRDLLGHAISRVACAVWWFHPLVWSAARRLRLESERACDDLAITSGARASEYAEHLLEIVTQVRDHATPAVAMPMARRSEFEGRMLAILDPALRRGEPGRLQARALMAGVGAMALVLSAATPARHANPASTGGEERMGTVPAANAPSTHDEMRPSRLASQARSPIGSSAMPASQATRTDTSTIVDSVAGAALRDDVPGLSAISPQLRLRLDDVATQAPASSDSQRIRLLAQVLATDSSAKLRRVAAWGLADFADDPTAARALGTALGRDGDASVREMAAWGLGSSDNPDRAVLQALGSAVSRDASVQVRESAAWALGSIGKDEPDVLTALESVIGRDSLRVKRVAIWAVGSVEPDRAPQSVIAALRDSDRGVRLVAAWALHNIDDPAASQALMAAFRAETDRGMKLQLLRAIRPQGDAAASMLADLLDSNDEELRSVAVRTLAGEVGSPWPWPWPRPRPSP